jgi:hypothetical protein
LHEFLWLVLILAGFSYLDAVIVKKEDFEWIRTGQKNIEEKAKGIRRAITQKHLL